MSDFDGGGYFMGEMQAPSDAQLLRDYAEHGRESAFAEIVVRHTNLVYSAALRQVESPDAAAEVAQQAFIGLARGARVLSRKLAEDASLAGWLCRTARNVSLNRRRDEFRRHNRERQAMAQHDPTPESAPDWEQLRPVLDEAMAELNEPDYDALVMRFYQNQDLSSVGRALGLSDDAAQKRVSRALDKLRNLLSRRGITTSAAALSVILTANAIQAAPVGLAATISTAAALGGTTVVSTATATATKAIAMTTLQKTLVTATVVVLAGAGIYEARQVTQLRGQNRTLQQQQSPLTEENRQLNQAFSEATNQVALLREDNERFSRNTTELVRLRGELVRLKQENANLKGQLPVLPSFAPGNTNGVAEGDYTSQDISTPKNAVAYSPGQAAGTPDTRPGNLTTAWTPREANAGPEWLQLEYAKAVDIEALKVYEEANSGAITRVTAVLPDGTETVLDRTHQPPRTSTAIYNFIFNGSVATAACVRVFFDTTLAPGRIAIDTVELRGRDGSKQWPARVRASSYYDGGTLPRSP